MAAGPDLDDTPARRTIDLGDAVLLPGLVDLHAHPDKRPNGSRYGVDPDTELLPRGITTVLSQGDAGSTDLNAYKASTIGTSRTRILLAINLSRFGEQGDAAVAGGPGRAGRRSHRACRPAGQRPAVGHRGEHDARRDRHGTTRARILERAIEASEAADGPLLFGTRHDADVSIDEQLALLRSGDVVTYCFSGSPENLLDDATGKVRDSVRAARERGVLFDVGHGMMSFDWRVAEACIDQGFPPDTISTDQLPQARGVGPSARPAAHDLQAHRGRDAGGGRVQGGHLAAGGGAAGDAGHRHAGAQRPGATCAACAGTPTAGWRTHRV